MYNSQKPIIFLAFANPKKDLDEDREINLFQELFNQETEFEYKFIFAADAKAIYDFFRNPQHRGRICVFHFSGHANKKYVLLNDKLTHGETLGSFLALQVGLQLVVINACETQNLGSFIIEKGIPAVIATNQPVKDLTAARFTRYFYENLLNGNTIEIAFQNATSGNEFVSERFSLFRGLDTGTQIPADIEYISLYSQKYAKDWTLASAINNPYFGLPKLPPNAYDNLPEVPFIGLRPYDTFTSPLFFGRAKSIRELIVSVDDSYSKLILLYGKSGVGKSSVLAAGVEGRLKQAGYASKYSRRSSEGLLATLAEALHCTDANYQKKWGEVESTRGRPLIVILDQVEEAITNHRVEEIEALAEVIISIFNTAKQDEYTGETLPSPILGKLILGYREEFHAQIENIFRQKGIATEQVLIEPLTHQSIKEIVEGIPKDTQLLKKYKLTVPSTVTDRIQAKLSEDTTDAISPVLQLLLTNMWEKSSLTTESERTFAITMLDALLDEGIWLKDFVKQQLNKVEELFPNQIKSGLVLDLLQNLTTDLGTARAVEISAIFERYDTHSTILTKVLKKLDDLYVVAKATVNGEEAYRLSHDTLALIVRKMNADSILPGQVACRLVAAKNISEKNPFGESDIKILRAGRDGMKKWGDEEKIAFQNSESQLQKYRRKTRLLWTGIFASILIAFGLLGYSFLTSQKNLLVSHLISLAEQTSDKTLAAQASYKAWKLEPENASAARLLSLNLEASTYQKEFVLGSASKLIFSDNKRFVAAIDGNIIKIYNSKDHSLLSSFGAYGPVYELSFSQDDSTIAGSGGKGVVTIWDWKNKEVIDTRRYNGNVNSLAFSPDGKTLAVAGYAERAGAQVWVWNCKEGRVTDSLGVENKMITTVSFSRDSRVVIMGGTSGRVWAWDWNKKNSIKSIQLGGSFSSLAFSPDSSSVAIVGTKFHEEKIKKLGGIWIWDWKAGKVVDSMQVNDEVRSVGFSKDGLDLVAGGSGGKLYIWERKKRIVSDSLDVGHVVDNVFFIPGDSILASGGEDGRIWIWHRESGRAMNTLNLGNGDNYASFSNNGRILAIGGNSQDGVGKIWFWDVKNKRAIDSLYLDGYVKSLAYSPKRGYLAVGGGSRIGGRVWLIDLKSGVVKDSIKVGEEVSGVVFSPDGTAVVATEHTAGTSNWVWVWKLGLGIDSLQVNGETYSSAFSPDGRFLSVGGATGNFHSRVWIWDREMRKSIDSLQGRGYISSVAFSSDGTTLAAGGFTPKVGGIVWVRNQRTKKTVIYREGGSVNSISFSPDCKYLAFCGRLGNAGLIRILNLESGQSINYETEFHVNSVAFSPDGSTIVAGGMDGLVWILDFFDVYLASPNRISRISLANYFTNGLRVYTLQKVLEASRLDRTDLMRLIYHFNDRDRRNQDYNLHHLNWCYEQLINLTKVKSEKKYLSEEKTKVEVELKSNPAPFYLTLWWQIQRFWYSIVLFLENLNYNHPKKLTPFTA
ncbi:CHAT domain-containing protein [Dyadobacter sp. 32]|uniref:nSTAND1 domain-containing NTPase n=1 Tax=Dyadobacter sp. 32 TaxID=538966 RepID=UPI0011EBA092